MKERIQLKAMVGSVIMLKEEKAAIENSIRKQEQEVINELMNQGMSDYLTINWTRLKRLS